MSKSNRNNIIKSVSILISVIVSWYHWDNLKMIIKLMLENSFIFLLSSVIVGGIILLYEFSNNEAEKKNERDIFMLISTLFGHIFGINAAIIMFREAFYILFFPTISCKNFISIDLPSFITGAISLAYYTYKKLKPQYISLYVGDKPLTKVEENA